MNKQTFGSMIATLRKKNGMTQLDLAEIFDVTVDELMQIKADTKENVTDNKVSESNRYQLSNWYAGNWSCLFSNYAVCVGNT